MTRLRLPAYEHVEKTGRTDPVLYHYYPGLRYFMNKRLSMALRLLGGRRFPRLLDAGCGGGIFLPELASRCDELHAIDVHQRLDAVRRLAEREGIMASFAQASVTATGFPPAFFDAIVSISVLEFVPDVGAALDEFRRIAKPGATVVLGFPADNVLLAAGYWVIRAPRAQDVHTTTFRQILDEARKRFTVSRVLGFPPGLPAGLSLYFACELEA